MMPETKAGCVHGRFQPFHLEHLEYVIAAAKRCQFLTVGITQYDIRALDGGGNDHRIQRKSNPLTYFERVTLIAACLETVGLSRNCINFAPFPIDSSTQIPDFVDSSSTFYTTICEPWNKEKVSRLQQLGLRVEVLWERAQKKYSGQEVRDSLMSGDDKWRSMVHPTVAKLLADWKIADRLNSIAASPEKLR